MNRRITVKAIRRGFWMGAMMLSAVAASAATQVTFQVDMTAQVTAGTFTPGTAVTASGTFNGWGQYTLTNNSSAANTNLFTGTVDDTNDANGAVIIYKYVTNNGTGNQYENTADGDNRCAQLPAAGGSLLLPVSFFADAGPSVTVNVKFQVDMAEQSFLGNFDTNNGGYVEVRGSFQGWSAGNTLTNDPTIMTTNAAGLVTSNVYVGTFAVSGPTNGTQEFKYVIQPGTVWEGPLSTDSDYDNSNNRFFINANQTLPIVAFSDLPYVMITVTNNVTFEVDMTTQIESGNFTTNANTVEIHGDFNNWGSGQTMTNNPGSSTPDIFSTLITYTGPPATQHYFKYVIQPGTQWENVSAANSIGGNRWFNTPDVNSNFVVGPVYFSDEPPSSLIDFVTVTNCLVTFTVNMTNAVGTDGVVFDGSGLPVYLNGIDNGVGNSFWGWGALQPTTYEMTNIPGTDLYSIAVPVNQGQNDELIYKYGINGNDDEAGFGDNHERWIRSLPDYTMPVDIFGSQGATTQVEIPAGDLTATPIAGNNVQLSWLGRRGVQLETANSLSPGTVWTPLPLSDGTNLIVAPGGTATTNYPIGQGNVFYQLIGPD